MSQSLENKCEAMIVAILAASVDLTGFDIVQRDTDASTIEKKDRIVVSAQPRQVSLPGQNPGAVKAWSVPCSVQLMYRTVDASAYDAKISAIEAALNASSPPASVQATWATYFPTGAQLEQSDDGTAESQEKTRERARNFTWVVMT
jgi:hypothetical protein